MTKPAESFGLNVSTSSSPSNLSHGCVLNTDTKECVVKFYNSSWQAPGHKDRVIMVIEGKTTKTAQQVRYMLMSLREVYHKFKEENPSLMVGLSKFCEWCPTQCEAF